MVDTLSESAEKRGSRGIVLTSRVRFDKKREWPSGGERLTCPLARDKIGACRLPSREVPRGLRSRTGTS